MIDVKLLLIYHKTWNHLTVNCVWKIIHIKLNYLCYIKILETI